MNNHSQKRTLKNLGLRLIYDLKRLVVILGCLVSYRIINSHADGMFFLSIYFFFLFFEGEHNRYNTFTTRTIYKVESLLTGAVVTSNSILTDLIALMKRIGRITLIDI